MTINLPAINDAQLPAAYEAARNALATCSQIDECQDWADKAAALASYAKQAKDESLRKLAERIQARAIRRCGELLKLIDRPEHGGRPAKNPDGTDTVSRSQAARDAGLSERQKVTALRVASVPEESFEPQVESENPPTVTALAEQGKKKLVDLGDTKPTHFMAATTALGNLRRFVEFSKAHDPAHVAAGLDSGEAQQVRQMVAIVDGWLDRLIAHLE